MDTFNTDGHNFDARKIKIFNVYIYNQKVLFKLIMKKGSKSFKFNRIKKNKK